MSFDITYGKITDAILDRWKVGRSWASAVRIGAVFIVSLVVLGNVITPDAPAYTDREIRADDPPSEVRYVAPESTSDPAGFLAPPPNNGEFNLAWVGGSEVKLEFVSLPGEFSNRIATVGDEQLVVDAYTIRAMRLLDTYRAVAAAIDNDADAIAVALNPVFTADEWSFTEWRNLDTSELSPLLRDRRTLPWFFALTSPGDVAQGLGVDAVPLLEASVAANRRQTGWFDRFDVLEPANDAQIAAEVDSTDRRLPADSTSFWLLHAADVTSEGVPERIAGIVDGFGVGDGQSDALLAAMVDMAGDAGIPIYFYSVPLDPTFIDDPTYASTIDAIDRQWEQLAAANPHDNVTIESRMLSRDFTTEVGYFDSIHPRDSGPFAEMLVERMCAQWSTLDANLECR